MGDISGIPTGKISISSGGIRGPGEVQNSAGRESRTLQKGGCLVTPEL